MAQPIVKYTLSKQGRIPEWLSSDSRAFAGEHSTDGNKSGYIPRYESPQSRIMLGIAAGEPDPDGTPDDYIGKIASKSDLQAYLIGIGTIAGYKTTTLTLTSYQTAPPRDKLFLFYINSLKFIFLFFYIVNNCLIFF